MYGLAKGHYVLSVLCTVGPAKNLASAMLGLTYCTSHGELSDGSNHGVYTTDAKVKLESL